MEYSQLPHVSTHIDTRSPYLESSPFRATLSIRPYSFGDDTPVKGGAFGSSAGSVALWSRLRQTSAKAPPPPTLASPSSMSNTDNNLTTVNLREFVFEYLIANCYASTANAFLEDEKRTKARREAYLHPPDVSSTPTAEDKLQELKLEADQRAATLARARKGW
ncbi:hypothetical protein FRC18_004604 [Serendipita sp. 400]|nr:hypothetical protein FRC18_004604 [Serendipita sp. 400]